MKVNLNYFRNFTHSLNFCIFLLCSRSFNYIHGRLVMHTGA